MSDEKYGVVIGVFGPPATVFEPSLLDRAENFLARIIGIEEFFQSGYLAKGERARMLTEALEEYIGEREEHVSSSP
jgi:hypothetical protein